ncbi:DnaA N-terminal domain-containing protein [Anaerosalibacter sp. Marseille-P3206]|uniref:DnaA N-terminal domain-containing protein n=1 Tax=Anaerosalibacter sp. Marseille-P3206 TaxID=1871005 RepID=UPI0013566C16|nr:DnaA N-terminal domain-containing protein [Anaerosalibacter sp. Marseille-P3206]
MPSKIDLLLKEIGNIKKSLSIIEEELIQMQNLRQETKTNMGKVDEETSDIWSQVIKVIKNELTEVSFNTWIRDIKLVSKDNNYFYISVPNAFHQNIIEGRYLKIIENALMFVTNKNYTAKVLVEETYEDCSEKWGAIERIEKTDNKYNFDNLIK